MTTRQQRESLRHAALEFLRRDWSFLPIGPNKKPALPSWKHWQSLRPTEQEIDEWLKISNLTGLAVISGAISGGLAIRDFDEAPAYARWKCEYPELASSLPTVATRRGYHVYFRMRNESYVAGGALPDGELRANSKHYTLAPPSLHPSGVFYRWEIPLAMELSVLDPRESGLLPSDTLQHKRAQEHPRKTQEDTEGPPERLVSSCALLCCSTPEDLEKIQNAIMATLPTHEGQRSKKIFELARRLKAIPSLAPVEAQQLEPILREWHRCALPHIRTKPFEESRIDFLTGWGKVKYPASEDFLDSALAQAKSILLPPEASRYEQTQLQLLVGLVVQLQRRAGDSAFFLSCRSAGRLLDVEHTTASRWLKLMVLDGLLIEVCKGTNETGKASEYRCTIGRK